MKEEVIKESTLDIIVGICDDEKQIVEMLYSIVNTILINKCVNYKILKFCSGEKMLKLIEHIDLVFLDVDMPQRDGFSIGSEINNLNPKCKIIMATGRDDCFKEAFKIKALRYVTKPFQEEEILEAIEAFWKTRYGEKCIEAYNNRNICHVRQKDILYIRAMDSYTEIITEKHIFRTEKSMSKLEIELEEGLFFRIHKQYIINLAAIKKNKKNTVVIKDKEFSISRRRKTEFEMKYLEYELKYG